jgi:hypothetical protein
LFHSDTRPRPTADRELFEVLAVGLQDLVEHLYARGVMARTLAYTWGDSTYAVPVLLHVLLLLDEGTEDDDE